MKTAKRESSAPERTPPSTAVLLGLFVSTGLAMMIHEVAWTRMARSLLGGDARALATALVAVLGGMGVGGLLAPRVGRRFGPLRGFALLELAAAVISVALPWLIPGVDALVGAMFRSFGPGAEFTVGSAVIAIVLFSVPSIALGAGLPLLADARASARETARDAGALYAVHAVGAAAGGLMAAFWLIPEVGIPLAVFGASIVQGAVALAAWRLGAKPKPAATKESIPSSTPWDPLHPAIWVLSAALLAGVATSALQTLWTRLASLAIGPSVQGFAIVAALYVIALAVGAGAAAPLARRVRVPASAHALVLLGAALMVLLGMETVGRWTLSALETYSDVGPGETPPWFALAFHLSWPIVLPVGLTAAAFPFAVRVLMRSDDAKRGPARLVGWLVAAGAGGNVIGVLASTFVAVPTMGLAKSVGAAAGLLAAAGIGAAVGGLRGGPGRAPLRTSHAAIILLGVTGVVGASFAAPERFDPDVLARGPFLYAGPDAPELGDVLFTHHGVDSTVTVRQAGGDRLLQIDGKVDASGQGDATTQVLVGLLPALLTSTPKRALVIGLGTGATADAVRTVPDVEWVEVAELVDGVRWAAPFFARWNGDVLEDERVSVRPVDGTLLLRHSDERFDLIVSEPSNPWVSGMGDLFSREAFEAAKGRLNEGGVFAAWFHVYSTDLDIVRSIVATFAEVFPDASLWELERGQDYMLVGRRNAEIDIHVDLDRLALRGADPEVRVRLQQSGVENAEGLLGRLVTVGRGLEVFARDSRVLTARQGSLEARAARAIYQDASWDALKAFAELPGAFETLTVQAETEEGRHLAERIDQAIEAGGLGRTMVLLALSGFEDRAIAAGERAVGLLPQDQALRDGLATLYLARGKTHALVREDAEARDALINVLDLDPQALTRADALATLGDLHFREGQHGAALPRYQAARRIRPTVADLTERIADCLEALGASEDAAEERRLLAQLRRR
ncbi:MAG: hypothetical protein AAGF12_12120 [Myxococcota bacterium]